VLLRVHLGHSGSALLMTTRKILRCDSCGREQELPATPAELTSWQRHSVRKDPLDPDSLMLWHTCGQCDSSKFLERLRQRYPGNGAA
jgi:hypothetical protein